MGDSLHFWKDSRLECEYQNAYQKVDGFFEDLYHHVHDNTTSNIDLDNLVYREGQNSYALDIMEAIKNKSILLVQAGVGIGKSFGYLLPVFYTYDNVLKFNKIVISTSSIALQQQLLKDIERISRMLGITLKAEIAKGINNYACLKKIYRRDVTLELREQLNMIADEIQRIESSDKADLKIVSELVWESVQLESRRYCSNCTYSKMCPYYLKQQSIDSSNIIITNHANLVRNVLDNGNIVQNVDMFIFDEAHKLEENMRNIRQGEIRLGNIKYYVTQLCSMLQHSYHEGAIISNDDDIEVVELQFNFIGHLDKLFASIKNSASRIFSETKKSNNDDYSIVDGNRLAFHYNKGIENHLKNVLNDFKKLFIKIKYYESSNGFLIKTKEKEMLMQCYKIFEDMYKGDISENLYWTEFFREDKINLCYVPKDNLEVAKKIFTNKIPIVCTSGTLLDTQDSYRYFTDGIGLKQIPRVVHGDSQDSPYDYLNNTLFYYNDNIASPNDTKQYVLDLAFEISNLIRATNGKALVLFTSKKRMNDVYNLLKDEDFGFDLLLHTDTNADEVRELFSKNVNSCLFATGVFWEGIDIRGKSLSNLIITHLPFERVDALTQYKASKYSSQEQFAEVYLPNMMVKLEQAVGRLIRSDKDTGIVSCLDSRFSKYKEVIEKKLPMVNYTSDMKEVYQFCNEKILETDDLKKLKLLNNSNKEVV